MNSSPTSAAKVHHTQSDCLRIGTDLPLGTEYQTLGCAIFTFFFCGLLNDSHAE